MFQEFNVRCVLDEKFLKTYEPVGRRSAGQARRQVMEELQSFVDDKGIIDGTRLQESWFPGVRADVFISHSHEDERTAMALTGWLHEKVGIEAFVDSAVWGNAAELLRIIDDRYCRTSGGMYSYERRNYSTAHVYIMLATSLTKMMDATECLWFLNTPNAISVSDAVETRTASPWILHEVTTAQLLKRRRRRAILSEQRAKMTKVAAKRLQIEYGIGIAGFRLLDANALGEWWGHVNALTPSVDVHPLDVLYAMMGVE